MCPFTGCGLETSPGACTGGAALRVRQTGRELHTAPYGPEQKCQKMGALGPKPSPPRGRPLGKAASS